MPVRVDIGNGYLVELRTDIPREQALEELHKQFPDSPGAQYAASRMATQPHGPGPTATEITSAFASGAGQGALNAGGLVQTPEQQAASQAVSPLAAGAGYLVGTGLTGGAIARGVRAIPGMAAVAGQGVRNILRLGAEGAAAGGAQAAAEGQDPAIGAAAGGIVGPTAAYTLRGLIGAARALGGTASEKVARDNAIRALVKRVNEDPSSLEQAAKDFQRDTGVGPTLTEIVNPNSAEELGRVADARISAANRFRGSAEQITAQRPNRMKAQIETGGQPGGQNLTDNVARLREAQNTGMNARMQPIENQTVRVNDPGRYLDPDAVRVLNHDLRSRLSRAVVEGKPAELTVRDIDDMRQAFDNAAGTGQKFVFNDLRDRITKIGTTQVKGYKDALNEFGAFERTISGFQNGVAAKTPGELTNIGDIRDAATQDYKAGRNTGVRTRLAEQAGSSEQRAISTADSLRQNAGLADETRGALGTRETARLQAQGAAETQSAERLAQATRAPKAQSEELERDVGNALKSAVAAGGHATMLYKANILSRIIASLGGGISSNTAKKLAEAATDPARLPDVIDALRRANLTEQQIRGVLLPAVSGGAGAAAGGAQ